MNPSKLFALFDKVKLYRKYPSLTFVTHNIQETIKIGMGNDPNILWVSNGMARSNPANKLYGKFIRTDFIAYRNDSFDIIPIMRELCDDPIKFGAMRGQQYKHCCFCNTELTSKESLFAGYGPICADNWGLPWGEVKDESLENL